jgi:hypothetical protein
MLPCIKPPTNTHQAIDYYETTTRVHNWFKKDAKSLRQLTPNSKNVDYAF